MADPLVVVSHLPHEIPFLSERFPSVNIWCEDDTDYWRGLLEHWDHDGPLVIVEHDMESSDDLIAELLDCPHPLCTHAYTLYWVSTGKPDPLYAHHVGGVWIVEGRTDAEYSGIGFCKINHEVRGPLVSIDPARDMHWSHVDRAVNRAVTARWHVHWPGADHLHWE